MQLKYVKVGFTFKAVISILESFKIPSLKQYPWLSLNYLGCKTSCELYHSAPQESRPSSEDQAQTLKKNFFLIYFIFLAVLGLRCCKGFSLVVESRGYALVVTHRLLIVVASLVTKHGLQGVQVSVVAAHGLSSCGSPALKHRLSSCGAWAQLLGGMWEIFPDQGSNLCFLHWQVDSPPLSHQESAPTRLRLLKSPCLCVELNTVKVIAVYSETFYFIGNKRQVNPFTQSLSLDILKFPFFNAIKSIKYALVQRGEAYLDMAEPKTVHMEGAHPCGTLVTQ